MGVGFSHGNAQWSYSGYYDFCNTLCKLLGYEGVDDFKYYYIHNSNDAYHLEKLVNLSDYDDTVNTLAVDDLKDLIPLLEKLIGKLDKEGYDYWSMGELIKGMKAARDANEPFRMT